MASVRRKRHAARSDRRRPTRPSVALFILLAVAVRGVAAIAAPACTLDRATGTTIEPQPFLRNGYGVRWNFAIDRLAYMQPDESGYYRIFTMRPDGSNRVRLTDRPGLSTAHQG